MSKSNIFMEKQKKAKIVRDEYLVVGSQYQVSRIKRQEQRIKRRACSGADRGARFTQGGGESKVQKARRMKF